jgi:outer membrane protein insertion porin family
LPFYENYYAGGFGSVRGFRDSSLGPRSTPSRAYPAESAFSAANTNACNPNTSVCTDPDQDPLPFGGNVLVQGGAELLFPLPFIKDQSSLRTSLFVDVGNVFQTNCDNVYEAGECQSPDIGELAISTGIGLTWITGFGPLSFSLAAPIKKPDNAETQIFQFSLGQTF